MGLLIGLVMLICLSRDGLAAQASDSLPLRRVGELTSWYEQADKLTATNQPLYLGGVWENSSKDYLAVRMILGAAAANGDLIGRCDVQLEGIPPGEKIWLTCKAGKVPKMEHVTVSSRTEWIQKVPGIMPGRDITPAETKQGLRSNDMTFYETVARIPGFGNRDTVVSIRFRLYGNDGVLLGVCGNSVTVVPEGAVEATSFGYCGRIPHRLGPVVRATVEVKDKER